MRRALFGCQDGSAIPDKLWLIPQWHPWCSSRAAAHQDANGKRLPSGPGVAGPGRGPFRPVRQARSLARKTPGVARKARSSGVGAFRLARKSVRLAREDFCLANARFRACAQGPERCVQVFLPRAQVGKPRGRSSPACAQGSGGCAQGSDGRAQGSQACVQAWQLADTSRGEGRGCQCTYVQRPTRAAAGVTGKPGGCSSRRGIRGLAC